jgi:hypothetical protein
MRTSIEGYSQAGSVGRPQPVASSFSPQSPAAPIFFFLPLSGRTSRVLDLEPVGRSATAIGGILPLRDDSFEPKLAGVAEHGLAVALYVVIEPNAMANPGEDAGQRRLADFERIAAEIVAVQLDQVEGVQKHAVVSAVVTDEIERGNAVLIASNRLAIDDAGAGAQTGERLDDQRKAAGQVVARPLLPLADRVIIVLRRVKGTSAALCRYVSDRADIQGKRWTD